MSTYDKILEVADTLIQKNGFEGFSYADLAKELGIRKASIHHHFPSKNDLGIAYCEKKMAGFLQLETRLLTLPAGRPRLEAYLNAFSGCAGRGQMCGVYAMLSDSNLFMPELQEAINTLARAELRIVRDVLATGQQAGALQLHASPEDMAVIVCTTLKGALLLNRLPPHDAASHMMSALLEMLRPD